MKTARIGSVVVIFVLVYMLLVCNPITPLLRDHLFTSDRPARSSSGNSSSSSAISDHGPANITSANFHDHDDLAATSKIKLSSSSINSKKSGSDSCDLYIGKWVHDSTGPVYTSSTCPIITHTQNCQKNGRPDKDYENWRWQPDGCALPRFDARRFLNLMAGKTIAFVGDSVARNQMESLICLLWQVETPENRGTKAVHRWIFSSTNTTIARISSAWLVKASDGPFPSVPDKVHKVFLEVPDESFMRLLPSSDVVVISSGHWFSRPSAYIINNTVVGGQIWTPQDTGQMQMQQQVNNMEAYSIAMDTILTAIAAHPDFAGLAILRSFSPNHYESGAWNTGGSCTGKVGPAKQVVRNWHTDMMHGKQVAAFQQAVKKKKATGKSKLIFMDITESFGHRPDGHPGPYRSTDPNKITTRRPDGRPPPQDCLHWCMPGPIDTWNEILLELIRRERESLGGT